jgi:hypothetical protein
MWEVDSTCTASLTIEAGIVHQSLKLWVMRLLRWTTPQARELFGGPQRWPHGLLQSFGRGRLFVAASALRSSSKCINRMIMPRSRIAP